MTTNNLELGETDRSVVPYAQAQPPGSDRDREHQLRRRVPLQDAMMGARPEAIETAIRNNHGLSDPNGEVKKPGFGD